LPVCLFRKALSDSTRFQSCQNIFFGSDLFEDSEYFIEHFFQLASMQGKIIVIGSANTDMVIKADKFPAPGETIIGGHFFMFPGGKGANQAVAAARLGGEVTLVAKVGNDIFGKQAMSQLVQERINTDFMATDSALPSGVALITVDAKGENSIVVASGANSSLVPRDIDRALSEISHAGVILLQHEIPLPTVVYAIRKSHEMGRKIILNPAPAYALPEDVPSRLYMITPNETESEILTGIKVHDEPSAYKAAQAMRKMGIQNVVITLGPRGAFVLTPRMQRLIPAPAVQAVDTTAAGDVFNGALAVGLSQKMPIEEAVSFACRAAALSVTRMGAQASAPYRHEL
jgi:ribokinase